MKAVLRKHDGPYYLFAIIIVFSDVLNNGNLNLLYFWSAGLIFCLLLKKVYFWRALLVYLGPMLLVQAIIFLFSKQEISIVKVIVYIAKIIINIALFSFFAENAHGFNFSKVICYIGIWFGVLLLGALLTRGSPWLWRLNDPFNNWSKTRLEFLFSEPSVLGCLSGYLLIFVCYSILEFGFSRKAVCLFAVFGLTLLLTFSLSAIAYTAIAVMCLLFSKLFNRSGRAELRVVVIFILLLCAAMLVLMTNNPISNRLLAMLHNEDASLYFRWSLSFESIIEVLEITNGYGFGLGNVNTPHGLAILQQTGMEAAYANSFLYFIAENGWLGITYILGLFLVLTVSVWKNRIRDEDPTSLKATLLLIVFIGQIAGGYFTDPLIWCLYGVISSRKMDKSILEIT